MKRLTLIVLLASGCSTSLGETPAPAAAPPAPKGPPALEVAQVVSQQVEFTASLQGELAPYEMVAIYPRANGYVEQVLVDRGSRVKRNQPLVRLSAPEVAAARAEAESKAAGGASTVEHLRAASATPGVVPKHDLEVAEAALKADEEKVRALRAQESYLVVSAPFDGIITERNIHPGALVGPPSGPLATPLLRLEQVGRLRLTVAVPESEAGAVTEGVTARFSVRAWPGQKFEGVARRISHSLDPKTRTMAVELDVENAEERLAPGMFAEVAWPIRRPAPSLLVPSSAVVQTPEKTYVDRVKDGAVEQVPVGRGVQVADKVEVFGPLQSGDTVLKRGSEELKTGDKVSPKPAQEQPRPK